MSNQQKVIVVGGGLSGLSAAHTLYERGANVVLLDKVSSARHPQSGLWLALILSVERFHGWSVVTLAGVWFKLVTGAFR
jgi:flavin-dependent dehydrogenase